MPQRLTSNVKGFKFESLTVSVGTTVTWANQDTEPHTSTSGAPLNNLSGHWNSDFFQPGQSFSFTFNTPGAFPFFCRQHPFMVATMTVTEQPGIAATSTPAPPTATPMPSSTPVPTPTTAPAPTPAPASVTSNIRDFRLESPRVRVGDTVTWVNLERAIHTTTQGAPDGAPTAPKWDSGNLRQNASFAFTFTEPGTFPYYCKIHPVMLGVVTVTE